MITEIVRTAFGLDKPALSPASRFLVASGLVYSIIGEVLSVLVPYMASFPRSDIEWCLRCIICKCQKLEDYVWHKDYHDAAA